MTELGKHPKNKDAVSAQTNKLLNDSTSDHELNLAKNLFNAEQALYLEDACSLTSDIGHTINYLCGVASTRPVPIVLSVIDSYVNFDYWHTLSTDLTDEFEDFGIKGLILLPIMDDEAAFQRKGIALLWLKEYLYSSQISENALKIWEVITQPEVDICEVIKALTKPKKLEHLTLVK
ncbi:MAG: hypothetical protein GY880_07785 [Planctomycetaceae bacterium]|jgi:hypothetical protein|nr:hypothetical protein [Planctomycetaceae bacterium]